MFPSYANHVPALVDTCSCGVRVLVSNSAVDNEWVRGVLINMKHQWEDVYFAEVCKSMQTVSSESLIEEKQIRDFNKSILDCPACFADSVLPFDEKSIANSLTHMSELPLSLMITKIVISEYFPYVFKVDLDEKHRIDRYIFEIFDGINKENGFRFLNQFDTEEYLTNFYQNFQNSAQIPIVLFRCVDEVYEKIQSQIPSYYKLLPYPEKEIYLGHITQLFPILEYVIRKIGELFGIVPFRAHKTDFFKAKDPAQILTGILSKMYEISKTFQGLNDFLFVYFAMFDSNGLNIRNECIHARSLQRQESYTNTFKVTVLCLYMMTWRYEYLIDAISKERSQACSKQC